MEFKTFLAYIFIFLLNICQYQSYETVKLIQKYGYEAESFTVKTADEYLLTIHRVVPKNNVKTLKYPCLLMHGFLTSSISHFQLDEDSLPFILSKSGCDVYLGNARSSKYSSHLKLSKTSSEYWNFSWHEIGIYDMQAMIDFVLNTTKASKINYYGMSQGATVVMVLLSTQPEYNDKINQLHLAGPAVFLNHLPRFPYLFQAILYANTHTQHGMMDLTDYYNFFKFFIDRSFNFFGIRTSVLPGFFLFGGNLFEIITDQNAIKQFIEFREFYDSRKSLEHFKQIIQSGLFRQFDYGAGNMIKYGTKDPPNYNLKIVTVRVYIYYGEVDNFISIKDINTLVNHLPNVVHKKLLKNFGHIDYEASRRAIDEIYINIAHFMCVKANLADIN